MNICNCLSLFIGAIICLIYWKRINTLPLHPDTAEFLYPGLVVSLKQKFEAYRVLLNRKWWSGTIIALIKKKFIQLEFPPDPYCELNADLPPVRGGNPTVQQKMAIYCLFQSLGRVFDNLKTIFRILQTVIILGIAVIMYNALACYTSNVVALCSAILALVLLSLPFFDTYQIHAELYGTILLLFAFWLISADDIFGLEKKWAAIISGSILVLLTIFVKITFVSDAFVFLLYPFFVSDQSIKLAFLKGEIAAMLLILFIFSFTRYFMKLTQILDPFSLMRYRRQMLSMHKNNTSNYKTDKNNFHEPHSKNINWFYLHFNLIFKVGLVSLIILGIIIGLFLHGTLLSLYGFLLLWVLISLTVLKFQNKFYAAHFIPPLIPITLLWGIATNDVINILISNQSTIILKHLASYGFLSLLIIPFFIAMWAFYKFVAKTKPSAYFLTSYLKRENPHILQLLAAPSIGEFIKKNSLLSDRIFCFGYANTVYLYAHRRASLELLEGCLGIDPEIANSVFANRWKWWICRDVHKFKPKYIVDMDGRLNIDAINDSTGLDYKLNKTFYECFNIYSLESNFLYTRFGGSEKIDDLVLPTSQMYEQRMKFNQELFKNYSKGFESMSEGLSDLMLTWQKSVDGNTH